MLKLISILFCFVTFSIYASPDLRAPIEHSDWIKIDEVDDISIYQNKAGMIDGVIPLQARGVIAANVSQILLVLSESTRRKEWLPRWREGKMLQKLSNVSRIETNVTTMPWPFTDREFTYQVDGELDYEKYSISLHMKSVEYPKIHPDTIVGFLHKGLFKIVKIDDNRSEFTMMFFSNPNGSIPNWVVNIAQKRWPYIFINSLRSQVAKRISEDPILYRTFDIFKTPKSEINI
jgi:hypothetical protein